METPICFSLWMSAGDIDAKAGLVLLDLLNSWLLGVVERVEKFTKLFPWKGEKFWWEFCCKFCGWKLCETKVGFCWFCGLTLPIPAGLVGGACGCHWCGLAWFEELGWLRGKEVLTPVLRFKEAWDELSPFLPTVGTVLLEPTKFCPELLLRLEFWTWSPEADWELWLPCACVVFVAEAEILLNLLGIVFLVGFWEKRPELLETEAWVRRLCEGS